MILFSIMILSCSGSDGTDSTDGDMPNDGDQSTDGDLSPDGDGTEDGDRDSPLSCQAGSACESDEDCGNGCSCDREESICREWECESAGQCESEYGEAFECAVDERLCYRIACQEHADCPACHACSEGRCMDLDEGCPTVTHMLIGEGDGLIRQGETLSLSLVALDVNEIAVTLEENASIHWSSSDPSIVSVDAEGVIRGESVSGTATITATLGCLCPFLSVSVDYQNFADVPNGTVRVVLFDTSTQQMVDGAKVVLNEQTGLSVDGIAGFLGGNCTAGCDLHVFKEGYGYVSVLGLKSNDLLIPLTPHRDTSVSAGVRGNQNAENVPLEHDAGVRIGFSGFSYGGSLTDLNFLYYMGTMFRQQIRIPPFVDGYYLMPAGLELYIGKTPVKERFMAQAPPGPATLWGMGGYGNILELGSLLGAEDQDWGLIMASLMPYVENFYHGSISSLELTAIPNITDTDDINGNQNTTELVPDFDSFDEVELTIDQPQNGLLEVHYPDLPQYADTETECADSILTLVTTLQPGIGYVPLGLNVALDSVDETEALDCRVGLNGDGIISAAFAPQYGPIAGNDYVVVSFATSVNKLLSTNGVVEISGRISRSSDLSEAMEVDDYLGIMYNMHYNSISHRMAAQPIEGATFHRARFIVEDDTLNEERTWEVYWGPDLDEWDLDVPQDIEDRSRDFGPNSTLQAVQIGETTYDQLFEFNGTNLNNINALVTAYSTLAIPR